jgi:hypothetical protein
MIKQFSENGPVGVLKPCCTTAVDHTRALTGARPIKLTSPRCPSAWQPNHGRRSTYRRGKTVQTTETTSGLEAHVLRWRVVAGAAQAERGVEYVLAAAKESSYESANLNAQCGNSQAHSGKDGTGPCLITRC